MNNKPLSKDLIKLIQLAKTFLWSDVDTRKIIQDYKVNITPANFYSDIPLINEINSSFEYREPGAEIYNSNIFDKETIQNFIDQLSEYSTEFSPPLEGNREDPDGFFWKNPAFSYSDAMSYYCVIRHFKPDHILEIGSGFSTLVANEAIKKNGHGKLTLIEPYPKPFLQKLDSVDTIIESFVQDIPVPELVNLVESADIWFIDSTHTVKVGSDCLYIYLRVMPQISKDILIHSHDIYIPYGFPKNLVLNEHQYWTEQYLLYAYLLDNPKIKILLGNAYAEKTLPNSLKQLMANKYKIGGSSIWYKLSGSSE